MPTLDHSGCAESVGGPPSATERRLIDRLNSLRARPAGWYAVRIALSRVRIIDRQPSVMALVLEPLRNLSSHYHIEIFRLGDCDIVALCRRMPVDAMQAALEALCESVREDLAATDASLGGDEPFVAWHDLAEQDAVARLHAWARSREAAPRERAQHRPVHPAVDAAGGPTTADFDTIAQRLDSVRFADLIKQQIAVHVQPGAAARPILAETYVSVYALRERLGVDADPAAHPWLFRHLTQELDRRMIRALRSGRFGSSDLPISLNVNVSTLAGPLFDEVCAAPLRLPHNTMFEIHFIDALADLEAYRHACDRLRDIGFGVVIDGINPLALASLNLGGLDADLVKLWWDDTMPADHEHAPAPDDGPTGIDPDRIVLARVDSEAALQWGMRRGIHRYQGRLIDGILRAEGRRRGLRAVPGGAG